MSVQTETAGERDAKNAEIGMLVALASFGMLFGALILSYFLARTRMPVWPPYGVDPVSPLLPSLSTTVILLASYFTEKFMFEWRSQSRALFLKNLRLTLFFTLLFLVLQGAVWSEFYSLGQKINSNMFSSIFYTLTGLHALHVLAVLFFVLVVMKKLPTLEFKSQLPKMCAWSLHFLSGVWLLMFLSLVIF